MFTGINYTTVDRILSKIHRDLRGTKISELDAIEWIGEALDFMRIPDNLEQVVTFLKVKDHQAPVPTGMHMVLQLARYNGNDFQSDCHCPEVREKVKEKLPPKTKRVPIKDACDGVEYSQEELDAFFDGVCGFTSMTEDDHIANRMGYPVPLDCQGAPLTDYEVAYYRPFFDLKWEYEGWSGSRLRREKFTPIRLSNHSFFANIVCQERDYQKIYQSCTDEYTLVGTAEKEFRFSFKDGYVALAYMRQAIDEETGYPLVPDIPQAIQAIFYYIKWKVAEWYQWNRQHGHSQIARDAEQQWLRYIRQTNNYLKMPKALDTYMNMLEQSHHLIPRLKRYYGFFGKLGRAEDRIFKRHF